MKNEFLIEAEKLLATEERNYEIEKGWRGMDEHYTIHGKINGMKKIIDLYKKVNIEIT